MSQDSPFIKNFSSLDEALKFFRERNQLLNNSTIPEQQALKPGDFCMGYDDTYQIVIYYEILEVDPRDPPMPPNRQIVRGYSAMVDDRGEVGVMHVALIMGKLTKEEFEKARELGWPDTLAAFQEMVGADWKPFEGQ